MLSEGQFASKVLAAKYLGEIGDERALPELERLYLAAEEHLPEGYTENPFAGPIKKIKSRIEPEPGEGMTIPDANETVVVDVNEKPVVDANRPVAVDANEAVGANVPAETEGVLDFFVVHKVTGEPVTGAVLDIKIQREGPDDKWDDLTDEQGLCRIDVNDLETRYIRIEVTKETFVPMEVWFKRDEGEVRIKIPSRYTLSFDQGTPMGGFVQNEEGSPIEGASVRLFVPQRPESGSEREKVILAREREVRTDANGFWRCDVMPTELEQVWIRLAHSDYVDDESYGRTAKPSMEELRGMRAVAVMTRGVAVGGKVVDSSGKPIEGAEVAQGSDRWGTEYPSTRTDAEGGFEFGHARPGEMVLTVQAKGYAPKLKEISAYEGMEAVEFRLGPARTIRGQVLDLENKPIDGVWVTADTWRGYRSIRWRSETDSGGYFEWNEAPADEVLFDLVKEGYMSVRHIPMSCEIDEYVIVMYPPLRVSGTVVDADSNEPIKNFRVVQGIKWEGGEQVHWQQRGAIESTNGRYEQTFTYPYDGHLIRVEAEGYMPGISRVFYSDEGDVVFDFALEKGKGPSGVVYLSDGERAEGAEVILCTASRGANIQNGRNTQKRDSVFVETGADGEFSFPAQTEPYMFVVLHEEGYAEVTEEELTAKPNIVIEPWGRVEGVVRIGSGLGAGETVSLYYERAYEDNRPKVYYSCNAVADVNGYFVMDRLPPGDARLGRQIRLGSMRSTTSHIVPVQVTAGETVTVSIGGTGRPVVGRVTVPTDYNEPIDWSQGHSSLSTSHTPQPPYPDNIQTMTRKAQFEWILNWQKTEEGKALIEQHLWPKYPDNITEMTMEEIQAWHKEWRESDEGKASMKAQQERQKQQRHYAVVIAHDGRFRVEDVPAGSYRLNVTVQERPYGRPYGYGEVIGSISHQFEVPDMNEARSDEPLDIGTLQLKIMKRLKVGDMAPEFEAETLDGKKMNLADYRGKVVLLNFWMSGQMQYAEEMSNLKEMHETFGKNEQFVMIGVSLNHDVEAAKKFIKENDLRWMNCNLTEKAATTVYRDYGIRRFPSTFVIGPDGRILAKNPSLSTLNSTLEQAPGIE
jgi:peroxiredoxin